MLINTETLWKSLLWKWKMHKAIDTGGSMAAIEASLKPAVCGDFNAWFMIHEKRFWESSGM